MYDGFSDTFEWIKTLKFSGGCAPAPCRSSLSGTLPRSHSTQTSVWYARAYYWYARRTQYSTTWKWMKESISETTSSNSDTGQKTSNVFFFKYDNFFRKIRTYSSVPNKRGGDHCNFSDFCTPPDSYLAPPPFRKF